jgi:hypothetical protein
MFNIMIENIIIIAVLVIVVGGAVAYIVRAKKKGQKCIGCPYGASCTKSCCSNDPKKND